MIVIAGLIVAACSSQPTQAPTHRWASTEAVDAAQYRNDHATCQAQANIGGKAFSTESPEFKHYKQCMTNQGYILTAYTE